MIRYGLCCISLDVKDQGFGHQTMTYKRFSSLPRDESLSILGDRILNNLITTNKTIQFCAENNYTYRVSSDIFPLVTYDEANVSLEDLPNHDDIQDEFDNITQTIQSIQLAVKDAEANSGYKIKDVVVGIAGQHIRSIQHSDYISRSNAEEVIGDKDIDLLINQVHKLAMLPGEEIIHVLPQ